MKFLELQCTSRHLRALNLLPFALAGVMLVSVITFADGPVASSNFVGVENPLSENGTWATMTSYSPYGTQFQKNNGAYPDRLSPLNHAAARTTATVPTDHYSEIVVGHVADDRNNVGPIARVQTSGTTSESCYLWWASTANGGNYLYRLDSHVPDPTRGTTYTATDLIPTSPVTDGDRLRLIVRGPVVYGLKNGVRDFIYNTGADSTRYSSGTSGIMTYADGAVNNAVIASWSTGAAPTSSGTWTSSNFAGTENPLDEGDRWYPLPGYNGFSKAGGQAAGLDSNHNASGVWSITPPASQYSEVTLSGATSGGGGPIVRIDRTNSGQTGWLLFLYTDNPSSSGIYKMTPDGNFSQAQTFTPTLVAGDKWRLTAIGNSLSVYRNGVLQLTYTTDGSYPSGDVGIEAYTQGFTFSGWQGGDIAGSTSPAPTVTGVSPTTGSSVGGTLVTITGTNFQTGATVTIGGSAAIGVTVVNSATITATTPAHSAGAANINVTNTDGQSATIPSTFTYVLPAPTIAGVSPGSGITAGGTPITITGSNFAAGATVTVGTSAAAAVTIVNSATITASTPAGPAGAVTVAVTNPDGQKASLANGFTYNAPPPPPTASSISPNNGPANGGTAVTITGANFTTTATVAFGANAATSVTVVNNTTIKATTPAGATGAVNVTVTNSDGQKASLPNGFTYTVAIPSPTLTSVFPNTGSASGGTNVFVSGTNFSTGATLTFGTGQATGVTVFSSTTIIATTPAGAPGSVTVTLTNGDGQKASLTNGFTYTGSGQQPLASSSFAGVENPLSENGTWITMTSYSPYGTVFQKNNGAYPDRLSPLNHAAARTTATVPTDHYSEIVVGHVATTLNNVGPIARVQTTGTGSESCYLWWASVANGGNYLYRLDSHTPDPTRGTTYTATDLIPTSPVVDGDRLRLIVRGPVVYGLKNGVRDFIYNTGRDSTKYSTGTSGIMTYADGAVNNAVIASWSTGAAPASSGTWTSSTFAGTENPLDEADTWYPLPGYQGFSKTGGHAIGLGTNHNASGVWSITPPAAQYSEVTLSTVGSGGGGPIVRIDRTNAGQTGWLLFLYADVPSASGIYKMTPDGNFSQAQTFTPTLVAGDKWRLTAIGNSLSVYRNGVLQLTYTTDGSYPSGDVGVEAYTQGFTFSGWQGGDASHP